MKECKFCSEAFINIHEKDADSEYLLEYYCHVLGKECFMCVYINEHGELAFWASDDDRAARKINFCPMCGREIPKITVTEAAEAEERET